MSLWSRTWLSSKSLKIKLPLKQPKRRRKVKKNRKKRLIILKKTINLKNPKLIKLRRDKNLMNLLKNQLKRIVREQEVWKRSSMTSKLRTRGISSSLAMSFPNIKDSPKKRLTNWRKLLKDMKNMKTTSKKNQKSETISNQPSTLSRKISRTLDSRLLALKMKYKNSKNQSFKNLNGWMRMLGLLKKLISRNISRPFRTCILQSSTDPTNTKIENLLIIKLLKYFLLFIKKLSNLMNLNHGFKKKLKPIWKKSIKL